VLPNFPGIFDFRWNEVSCFVLHPIACQQFVFLVHLHAFSEVIFFTFPVLPRFTSIIFAFLQLHQIQLFQL
jgi:hypothetical protein